MTGRSDWYLTTGAAMNFFLMYTFHQTVQANTAAGAQRLAAGFRVVFASCMVFVTAWTAWMFLWYRRVPDGDS